MEDKQILNSAAGKDWQRIIDSWDKIKAMPNMEKNEIFNAAYRLATQGNLEASIIASDKGLAQDNPSYYEEKLANVHDAADILEEMEKALRRGLSQITDFSLHEKYAATVAHASLYVFESHNHERVMNFFREHAIPSSIISIPGDGDKPSRFAAIIDSKYDKLIMNSILAETVRLANAEQGKIGLVHYKTFEMNCNEEKLKIEGIPHTRFKFIEAEMEKRNLFGGFSIEKQNSPDQNLTYTLFIPKRSEVLFSIIDLYSQLADSGLTGKNNILLQQHFKQDEKDLMTINNVLESSKRSKQYLFADKTDSYLIVDEKGLKFYPRKNSRTGELTEVTVSRDAQDFAQQYRSFAQQIKTMGLIHVPAENVTCKDSELKNLDMTRKREEIFQGLTSGLDMVSSLSLGAPMDIAKKHKEIISENVDKSFSATPLVIAAMEIAEHRNDLTGHTDYFEFLDNNDPSKISYLKLIEKVMENIDCILKEREAAEILKQAAANPELGLTVDMSAIRKELEESDRELKNAINALDEYGLKQDTKELLIASITEPCKVEYDTKNGIIKIPADTNIEDIQRIQKDLRSFAAKTMKSIDVTRDEMSRMEHYRTLQNEIERGQNRSFDKSTREVGEVR